MAGRLRYRLFEPPGARASVPRLWVSLRARRPLWNSLATVLVAVAVAIVIGSGPAQPATAKRATAVYTDRSKSQCVGDFPMQSMGKTSRSCRGLAHAPSFLRAICSIPFVRNSESRRERLFSRYQQKIPTNRSAGIGGEQTVTNTDVRGSAYFSRVSEHGADGCGRFGTDLNSLVSFHRDYDSLMG